MKLEEVARFEELSRMNTIRPNRRDLRASPPSGAAAALAHAQTQDEAAQKRKRIAKQELKRARMYLKEAKREAQRAREAADAAHKTFKKVRRKAQAAVVKATESPVRRGTPAKQARAIQQRRVKHGATAAPARRPAPAKRAASTTPRPTRTPRRKPAAAAKPETPRRTPVVRQARVHMPAVSARRRTVKGARTPPVAPVTVKPVEPRGLRPTPIPSTVARTRH